MDLDLLYTQRLDEMLEFNTARIQQQVEEVTSEINRSTASCILAMDFDECVAPTHFSKTISQHFMRKKTDLTFDFNSHGLKELASFFKLYIGEKQEDMIGLGRDLFKGVIFRNGFLEMLSDIDFRKNVFPVVISSGLSDIARIVLSQRGFRDIPVFGCDFAIRDGIIQGPWTIIDNHIKASIASKLAVNSSKQLVTLGHAKGDVELISTGTEGLRFSLDDDPDAKKAADKIVKDFFELKLLIGNI